MEEGDPVCVRCKATSSLMWHKGEDGAVLCLECHSNAEKASGSSSKANSETSSQNGHHPSGSNGQGNGGNATPTTSSHGRKTRLRERTSKAKQVRENLQLMHFIDFDATFYRSSSSGGVALFPVSPLQFLRCLQYESDVQTGAGRLGTRLGWGVYYL